MAALCAANGTAEMFARARSGPSRSAMRACVKQMGHVRSRAMNLPPAALLGIAIVAEVIATSALKASDGFTRLVPSVVAGAGYCLAFYLLALVMKSIPTGVVYAVWSGLGIVLISAVGWLVYGQKLDAPAMAGMALIVAGVAVIHLFSKASAH